MSLDAGVARIFDDQYHSPAGEWPKEYGIAGNPVPDGYLAQLTYPVGRERERVTGGSSAG